MENIYSLCFKSETEDFQYPAVQPRLKFKDGRASIQLPVEDPHPLPPSPHSLWVAQRAYSRGQDSET